MKTYEKWRSHPRWRSWMWQMQHRVTGALFLGAALSIPTPAVAQSGVTFTKITTGDLVTDLAVTAGADVLDYDNDGFLDLHVSNGFEGGTPEQDFLYHNEGNGNHWLKVTLRGTASNRSGIGAKVEVVAQIRDERVVQVREISTRSGWSGGGLQVHFGLGDGNVVDLLRVSWPSGQVQKLRNVAVDQILVVEEINE